jgi:hypothetical protein
MSAYGTHSRSRVLPVLLAAVTATILAAPPVARGDTTGPYAYPPPVNREASKAARAEVRDRTRVLREAEHEMRQIAMRAQKDFEHSGEYLAAEEAVKEAQAKLDALTTPILTAVRTDPAYQAALAEKQRRQDRLRELKAAAPVTPEQLQAGAAAVLEAGKAVTQIEADALAAEPAVAEARAALAEATARLTALRDGVDDQVRADPDWQNARAQVEAAKGDVTGARRELSRALKLEAEQDRARKRQIADIRRREAEARRQAEIQDRQSRPRFPKRNLRRVR